MASAHWPRLALVCPNTRQRSKGKRLGSRKTDTAECNADRVAENHKRRNYKTKQHAKNKKSAPFPFWATSGDATPLSIIVTNDWNLVPALHRCAFPAIPDRPLPALHQVRTPARDPPLLANHPQRVQKVARTHGKNTLPVHRWQADQRGPVGSRRPG